MRCSLFVMARTRRPWMTTSWLCVGCFEPAMCSNELASSRLNRPGFWSTVLSWTGVRPFWRVIVFFAPIGVPAHSGAIASSDVGNEYRSFFSAIAKTRLPLLPAASAGQSPPRLLKPVRGNAARGGAAHGGHDHEAHHPCDR